MRLLFSVVLLFALSLTSYAKKEKDFNLSSAVFGNWTMRHSFLDLATNTRSEELVGTIFIGKNNHSLMGDFYEIQPGEAGLLKKWRIDTEPFESNQTGIFHFRKERDGDAILSFRLNCVSRGEYEHCEGMAVEPVGPKNCGFDMDMDMDAELSDTDRVCPFVMDYKEVASAPHFQLMWHGVNTFLLNVYVPESAKVLTVHGIRNQKQKVPSAWYEQYGTSLVLILAILGSRWLRSRKAAPTMTQAQAIREQIRQRREARAGQNDKPREKDTTLHLDPKYDVDLEPEEAMFDPPSTVSVTPSATRVDSSVGTD